MNILAIESSCDETAVAVIKDGAEILSNIIASQVEIHARYGGVVPEVAARSHIEVIIPVIEQALEDAEVGWDNIDAIATTKGPGLIGSLLIGVMTARTLAITKQKPLIGVNHIWAHAFASFLTESKPEFPFLALTVSGGHTALSLYKEDLTREVIGETLDDAGGEAFDKVAKLIGLPYPGGPAISKAAENGDENAYKFPLANLGKNSFDFSFSGLKTAVLRQVQEITGVNPGAIDNKKTYTLSQDVVCDISASFQKAAVGALLKQTQKAYLRYNPKSLVVGGGVACNNYLRDKMTEMIPAAIFVPPVLCTDNAVMIGALAYKMYQHKIFTDPLELKADSSLEEI
ncbi:MAG: tRNA (adenosine(37)-N6)-threonylcarbamoyltransferase complex transferase subunit TsaD [Candidatus Saccharibacteria bacterium]